MEAGCERIDDADAAAFGAIAAANAVGRIARIERDQIAAAAELHQELAALQFVARAGRRFLARYYLAWGRTDTGIALAATDERGRLTGVLLGSVDPGSHYQDMIRRDGAALALRLIEHGILDPSFGRELIVTRLRRYSRGLARAALKRLRGGRRPSAAAPRSEAIGEIAVLLVHPQARGSGIGRALVDTAAEEAGRAGLSALTLVTPPGLAAGGFYEHLGWTRSGSLRSRSGEPFVAYRLQLPSRVPSPGDLRPANSAVPTDPAAVAGAGSD